MRRIAKGLAVLMAAPLAACYAGDVDTEIDDARDHAIGGGKADSLGIAPPEALDLLEELSGYYVLSGGADSEGALSSLYLEDGVLQADGVATGESRRRDAACDAYSCGYVIGDAYRALPASIGINAAYLLLDAGNPSPTEFYVVELVERDEHGDLESLVLRYSPSPDVIGDPFVMTRWDGGPDIRPDLEIETMAGLPGHFVREDTDPADGELLSVQFGVDSIDGDDEAGGQFVREVALSCSGADCNREAGDSYIAKAGTDFGIGVSYIEFHTDGGAVDAYIVDEIVRDSVGTIVRLSVRHWGDRDFGEPFSLARVGYPH